MPKPINQPTNQPTNKQTNKGKPNMQITKCLNFYYITRMKFYLHFYSQETKQQIMKLWTNATYQATW